VADFGIPAFTKLASWAKGIRIKLKAPPWSEGTGPGPHQLELFPPEHTYSKGPVSALAAEGEVASEASGARQWDLFEPRVPIERHGKLKLSDEPGQSHHLSQDAAFKSVVDREDGMAIKLNGNAFTETNSPHYNAHRSLEMFWDVFRRGGARSKELPTIVEYLGALKTSLRSAGLSELNVERGVAAAKVQLHGAGLTGDSFVPRVPRKINQVKNEP
jgi:hypothetical protein